ncbi:SigB/SigF/SigG family RNA polymerase sigma factor [Acetobacterium fimetarium]|uniref:SigB/SigF/SigG family RNA polymerase sigma factor n=1 Tax=Acetobacterium fimetarium TaxID=52691 RepID=A0ABR6WUL5_9FIRM|nr:SigB/SigF/SigG family RNA polymerase sigma factor [Acetobacterium fimetarium]MBC3803911.1 SigB/SigF/SigG family RNA polymerase sigma factor [Acetobacterium fimetarium]
MKYERKISKEDVKQLFIEYEQSRDRELRDLLIENYLYIPKILSRKYGHKSGDNEDIFQVACLGLMYAVERFDVSRGYEFDTFATPTIIGEIKRYYRDREWLIRIPRKIQDLNREINQTRTMLEHKLMRSPTITEIANYLEIPEENVIKAMESSNAYYPKSLSMEYESNQDGQEVSLMDILGNTDNNIENVENIDLLKKKIQSLNPVERIIVEQRFFQGKTQKEVAEYINKSQMTVSRIEKRIMKKIKEDL